MRPALATLFAALLAGCQKQPVERPPPPPAPAAVVSAVIELRSGDGRVYVIKSPDQFGLETSNCFLHVAASGAGSMACTPPRIEVMETQRP